MLDNYYDLEDDDLFNLDEIDLDALDDGDEIPSILDIEMVGKTFWKNLTEFGDKTREIATEIILKFVQGTLGGEHALPTYVSVPMKSGDLIDMDIDATLEAHIEHPLGEMVPWGFERRTSRNPVLLVLDTSYSMNGQKLTIAGIVVGVLAHLLPSTDLAVIGFNKEPYMIKRFDEAISKYYMIHRIMSIKPRGGTNLADAIRHSAQMIFPYHPHGRVIMLTDADPTSGKNPIPEASKLHTFDLLLFPDGNEFVAQKLCFEAHSAEYYRIKGYPQIQGIIKSIFERAG
ncbi:MAG: vWA domain-containing protein [Candidatus Kariarchaeaceae archaeon]